MSKVVLTDTSSGYRISVINENFQKIQDELNDKVLYRDNPTGEPNQMESTLDMNSQRIINLSSPQSPNDAARLADIPFDPIPIGTTSALLTTFTPAGSVSAINVQAAIEEVASEAVLETDLASSASASMGAGLVGYEGRTVWEKLQEIRSVRDYGAVGDGVADDTSAVVAMVAAVGYAMFTAGAYRMSTATIDAPLYFGPWAYITMPAGQTLTLTGSIDSSKQWIFRGDGNYALGHDSDSGENTRAVHASWFGAFPYPGANPVDQAPFIDKAFASMGNLRESIVEFDIGNYMLRSSVGVTRGGWVRGAGARRTVFLHDTDGFDSFATEEVACRFSGIQFELHTITDRESPFIRIAHADCEVYDSDFTNASKGIIVEANNCRIDNLRASYGANPGAGSSLVLIEDGANTTVSNLLLGSSSAFGPEAIVHIGGAGQTATIGNVTVRNINTITPAKCVFVDAQAATIRNLEILNIRYAGFAGTAPAAAVHIRSAGSVAVDEVAIDGVRVNSHPSAGIVLEHNSSGVMQDVLIDHANISGAATGISFTSTSGALREIVVGSAVDVSECATPYAYSGSTSDIRIAPEALPNVRSGYCYEFTVADDAVASIELNRSVFTGALIVTVGSTNYGMYVVRAAVTPAVTAISNSANMETALTSLAGTTGTDAKFTTGVTNGVLYLENRLGASQTVNVSLLSGF